MLDLSVRLRVRRQRKLEKTGKDSKLQNASNSFTQFLMPGLPFHVEGRTALTHCKIHPPCQQQLKAAPQNGSDTSLFLSHLYPNLLQLARKEGPLHSLYKGKGAPAWQKELNVRG